MLSCHNDDGEASEAVLDALSTGFSFVNDMVFGEGDLGRGPGEFQEVLSCPVSTTGAFERVRGFDPELVRTS